MIVNKIRGLIRLIRPKNSLMMGVAVIIAEVIALRGQIGYGYVVPSILGFLTALTLAGSSFCVNDYYDRDIDAMNEPSRPMPSGLIEPRDALMLASVLIPLGLLFAVLVSYECLLLASLAIVVSVAYSYNKGGKRRGFIGNGMVSLDVAMPFIYGTFVVGRYLDELIIIFAVLAFLSNLGREVTKGIVDLEGDRGQGIETIAVLYSERAAAFVAVALYLSAVGLSVLPWALNLVSFYYLPIVLVADAGFVVLSALLLSNYSRENARRVKNLVLVCMLLGLAAFAFGGII